MGSIAKVRRLSARDDYEEVMLAEIHVEQHDMKGRCELSSVET
jgi:hypothetical protein